MDRLKELLALIEADLRDNLMPTPAFTFDEWKAVSAELRAAIAAQSPDAKTHE
jgi:hypothetical protein